MNKGNLVEYLENEIEKLKNEIKDKKNRHYVNQNTIDECGDRIKEYLDKDDSVFNLLSPISIESSYKNKIEEEKYTIEKITNENLCLISEIDECNNKICEIEKQLELQRVRTDQTSEDTNLYSSASGVAQDTECMEDWASFINKILAELDVAQSCCYSNPKACKDILNELSLYIKEMCFGND